MLHCDWESYYSCLLVCRMWYYQVVPLLYHAPSLKTLWATKLFINSCRNNPRLVRYVKKIELSLMRPLSAEDLSHLLMLDMKLTHLDLRFCRSLNDAHLDLVHGPTLKFLCIGNCNITDQGFCSLLRRAQSLEHLNIQDCASLSDSSLEQLGCSQTLLELQLVSLGSHATSRGFLQMYGFCNLKSLNLYDCKLIDDQVLQYLSTISVHLTSLQLFRLPVTDHGMQELVKNCSRLTTLGLSEMKRITDRSLILIGRHLKLEHLVLGHSDNLTDIGVITMLQEQKQLKALDISLVGEITLLSLLAATHCCPLLQDLVLSGNLTCDAVPTKAILSIMAALPCLETFSVFQSMDLLPRDIETMIQNCHRLRQIYIHQCVNIHPCLAESFRNKRVSLFIA
ncbi:hypothetical protein EDD86DRAFT_194493 [Gorgonomyces haynaldii]|nr:hypothetical protein EDD86DRAFT_194493 [Gorgonomyces haynaldii]